MNAWYARSEPHEIKPFPWLCPKAIQEFEKILSPEFDVIEHGSGGSTLWLADKSASVVAVEIDKLWRESVEALAPANVRVLTERPTGLFDVIFIDGDPLIDRVEWLKNINTIVKRGGWVVLDNANRPDYAGERLKLINACRDYFTIDGNEGTTRYLVTDFYRMPQ